MRTKHAVGYLLNVWLLACSGESTVPVAPELELVEERQRVEVEAVNAWVYGSFIFSFGTDGPVAITSGRANFPGHPPAGPGTCDNGLWINAQGKRTAGSLEHPHPHCVTDGSAVEVVLEPISACFSAFRGLCPAPEVREGGVATLLDLSSLHDFVGQITGIDYFDNTTRGDETIGAGEIVAYAIDASTLGTTNRRVGTLSFSLDQYDSIKFNYVDPNGADGCVIDVSIVAPCLGLVITASYTPLPAPDGIGAKTVATGFLWVAPATAPYNYGS